MNNKPAIFNWNKLAAFADWKLLAFLILFMDVKIAVKIVALIAVYLLQFDFKLGFSFKNSRLPLFYPIVIGIAILNWVIYSGYVNTNYNIVFITGIGFWLLCILALHQVKLSVERNDVITLHNTIWLFFVLNAVVSFFTLGNIIREIHTINPYRYQGQYQKYFIGTGDYIKGLTFDVSTTNAALNAFGVIYFLTKKNILMVLLCMVVMLMAMSNTINMMLTGVLVLLFLFKTSRDQKSVIVVCVMFLAIFIFKVSPQNDEYLYKVYYKTVHRKLLKDPVVIPHPIPITDKPDSILSPEELRQKRAQHFLDSTFVANNPRVYRKEIPLPVKPITTTSIRPEIPTPSIHTPPFQHRDDTTAEIRTLTRFINAHKANLPQASKTTIKAITPGKVIAMQQTLVFMKAHPARSITGTGIGNFSSKLAFKATNLGVAGGFPAHYAYIDASFLTNHLDVYLNFFSRTAGLHSLLNSPNSVYDQLFGEYGLLGVLAFVLFYTGYFLKHYKYLTYGVPLLILMSGILIIDYWFEQLSIILFFELLLLVNIKETNPKTLVNEHTQS